MKEMYKKMIEKIKQMSLADVKGMESEAFSDLEVKIQELTDMQIELRCFQKYGEKYDAEMDRLIAERFEIVHEMSSLFWMLEQMEEIKDGK